MIAAAGIAIVFPPAGTAAAAHILLGAAGSAAAKDGLGRALKAGAAAVTGKWLKGSPTRTAAHLHAAVELLSYDLRVIAVVTESSDPERTTATAAIGVAVTDLLAIVRGYCLRGLGDPQLEQSCRLALKLLDECRDDDALMPDRVSASASTLTGMADALDGWAAQRRPR
jgi:hypothetical protein